MVEILKLKNHSHSLYAPTAWVNRSSDHKSIKIEWAWSFLLTLLTACFGIILYFFGVDVAWPLPDSIISIFLWILFTFFLSKKMITSSVKYWHLSNGTSISEGSVGLVRYLGSYTGEVAAPGMIYLPLGFDFEVVKTSILNTETGLVYATSIDGFKISSDFSIWHRIYDPLRFIKSDPDGLSIEKLAKAAIFSSISKHFALDIVANKNALEVSAQREIEPMLDKYGIFVEKCALSINEIPKELSGLAQMLTTLEKRYPDRSSDDLIDIILTFQGKKTISISESRSISRIELPAIDSLIAYAERKFKH